MIAEAIPKIIALLNENGEHIRKAGSDILAKLSEQSGIPVACW